MIREERLNYGVRILKLREDKIVPDLYLHDHENHVKTHQFYKFGRCIEA